MRTVTYKLEDLKTKVIHIGKVAENEATRVQIDAGSVFAEYPAAVPAMSMTNPEGTAFPVSVERSGDMVLWDVKDSALAAEGQGEIQFTFTEGNTVAKSVIGRVQICRSIVGDGEAPDPIQDWMTEADAALEEIENISATAETLAAGSAATASYADGVLSFGIPQGAQGAPGQDGQDGADGQDGVSPTVAVTTITGGHTVTITDAQGDHAFNVMDGTAGAVIDDTAGAGDTDKTWSADKLTSDVLSAINELQPPATASDVGKAIIVKTVADGKPTSYEYGEAGGGGVDPQDIEDAVDAWLTENITNPDSPPLDRSLSSSSSAAPADIVGSITQKTKNIFDKSIFNSANNITIDENGYYAGTVGAFNAAFSSLFPVDGSLEENTRYTVSLTYYISNVGTYTSGALAVKATYSDNTTASLFTMTAAKTTPYTDKAATAESKTVSKFTLNLVDYRANSYTLHIKDIQIEKGTVKTDYVDHITAHDKNAESQLVDIAKNAEIGSRLYNPFANKFLYYHMHQEVPASRNYIPAQSLYDIQYAKSLGFNMIEVNAQKCSDDVFVCKHGNNSALGAGIKSVGGTDYSSTLFSSVTSTWIRQNILYDSVLDKYCGHIPTLQEFCAECKRLSMMVKITAHINDIYDAIDVARQYLPDDMIWATFNTNVSKPERNGFCGVVEYVWFNNVDTIDGCIEKCKLIGAPVNIVIAANQTASITDATLSELTYKAHKNGFTVGVTYPTPAMIIRFAGLGVDVIGSSENAVNLFTNGKTKHITNLSDESLILSSGAVYDSTDDVINMASGSTISCAASMKSGMCSLVVRYNGTLTIYQNKNDQYNALQEYVSDGHDYVYIANAFEMKGSNWDTWFVISADAQTTIYELMCDCEIV